MTPKYNIGNIVLVPMEITKIIITSNQWGHEEATYRMCHGGQYIEVSEWMTVSEKMEVLKGESE